MKESYGVHWWERTEKDSNMSLHIECDGIKLDLNISKETALKIIGQLAKGLDTKEVLRAIAEEDED